MFLLAQLLSISFLRVIVQQVVVTNFSGQSFLCTCTSSENPNHTVIDQFEYVVAKDK